MVTQFILTSVPVSIAILTTAIIFNFMDYDKRTETKAYKKSKVETFSMYGFVIVCYLLIVNRIGMYDGYFGMRILGASVVYFSLIINLYGRVVLQSNWSNQIRIRKDHEIVTKGPFKLVRHPLYSSTITMIYGAALCYNNLIVIVLNTVVFIPMMVYRAKQEEVELAINLKGYKAYQQNVGMLFPKRRTK